MSKPRKRELFSQYGKGLLSRGIPRLSFPTDALISGSNCVLAEGGLKTSPGYTAMTGNLPAGEVMWLGQVRFPTTEVSYLLAQVRYVFEGVDAGQGLPGDMPSYWLMDWNTQDGQLCLFYWNTSYSKLECYEYDSGSFILAQQATLDIPPWDPAGMIYDPVNHELVFFSFGASTVYGKSIDLATLTWNTEWSGTAPANLLTWEYGHWVTTAFYRSGTIVCTHYNDSTYNDMVLQISLSTHNATEIASGISASVTNHYWLGVLYDATTDYMWAIVYDRDGTIPGYSYRMEFGYWKFSDSTWHETHAKGSNYEWSSHPVTASPKDDPNGRHGDSFFLCQGDDKIYRVRNDKSTARWYESYDRTTGVLDYETMSAADYLPDGQSSDTFIRGLMGDDSVFYSYSHGPTHRKVFANSSGCLVDPFPTSAEASTCKLYATAQTLPNSSATWTAIYDLGVNAGVISVAVLGDRCIITEANHVVQPLVWLGCLSTDGSDWAYPKHVLCFKNGQHAYDIGQYVLDKDSTNSADVGNIDTGGYFDLVTDVPNVEAFYLEMGTPNSGLSGTGAYSVAQAFTSVNDVDRQDLKSYIVYWKRNDDDTNLDAAAAVDKGSGLVGLPCTGQPYSSEDWIVVSGTTNYNGLHMVDTTSSTNEIVIEATYVAESFSGSEVTKLNRSTGHFEGTTYYLDAGPAVDKGSGKVGLPMTSQPFSTDDRIEVRLTTNYNGTYSVDATSSTNEVVITHAYTAESFAGTETINARITLGSGGMCPNIEVGLEIILSGVSKTILTITNDGDEDDEVEISSQNNDDDVDYIYGLNVISNKVTLNYAYDNAISAITRTPTSYWEAKACSIRLVIKGSELGGTRTNPKFTFRHYHYTHVTHASIGIRSGSTANTTTTPTEITFNGGQSGFFDTQVWEGARSGDYPPAAVVAYDIESDILDGYTLNPANDYIVIIDVAVDYFNVSRYSLGMGLLGSLYPLGGLLSYSDGYGYYVKGTGQAPAEESWDQSTVTGYSEASSGSLGLVEIESQYLSTVYSTQPVVGHTTNNNRLLVTFIDEITGVTVSQSTPGSSTIYHAVSLDERATFQVFKASAWRSISRLNGATWEYNDSATSTPNWVSATVNSRLGALWSAFGVSYNQMSATELAAITSAQWEASGGIDIGITRYIDWGFLLTASGSDRPWLASYTTSYLDNGSTIIEGYQAGDWEYGSGWQDNTAVGGVPLAQDGSITYLGTSAFEADYHIVDQIPGYHYRLKMYGTSSGTSITRVLYKAPCQALSNIGLGQPDYPLAFIWNDEDSGEIIDYTWVVIDETFTEISSATTELDENKWVYIGGLAMFTALEIIPFAANTAALALTIQYWNGLAWTNLTIVDGTSEGGAAFGKRGMITWAVPSTWKTSIPIEGSFDRGYYVRITASSAMDAGTKIAECRIYSIPDALVKHRECVTFRDRVALISRPDFNDMVEVSREMAEYGFWGLDSGQYRVGGMDGIQCAVSAWNMLLLGKRESWQALTGSSPSNFTWTTIEAARHIPINSRVIVKAPIDSNDGLRNALFFINQYGAFAMSGLQADTTFATGRVADISRFVDWWDDSSSQYLDVGTMASTACGAYWPRQNWIVWAVPMIVSGSSQSTNNRLLIYDLTLGAWLPPRVLAIASICQAYHYDADVPGKLADIGLYAGDYSGNVLRLFAGTATTDNGTAIAMNAKTGLITFGNPGVIKELSYIRVFGQTTGSGSVKLYRDSESTPFETKTLVNIVNPSSQTIDVDYQGANKKFRSLQLEFDTTGPTEIDAIEIEYYDSYPIEGQGI